MSRSVVFVTPAPRMLRAGAVWVTIGNWVQASQRRWGKVMLVTPDGLIDQHDVRKAMWDGMRSSPSRRRRRHPWHAMAATAAKDLRGWWLMSRFDSAVRRQDFVDPPLFVWQHHDPFQRAGFTLARRYECPLVLFVDAPVVWESSQWRVSRPVWGRFMEELGESRQFREAHLVACVTDEVAEAVIERGASPERVLVTPCTADLIRAAHPRGDLRRELGLGDHIVIGWVGSFRSFHQADMIVRAVAALKDEVRTALLMVGSGPALAGCRRLSEELGVQLAVFPGAVKHEEVPEYLAAMDIAVVPSRASADFHYSPLKLKEYLAAGKAVVAPNVGEMARTLHHGYDALLYPAGDEPAMVKALSALSENDGLRRSLQNQGRETYDRLFTMDPQLDLVSDRLNLE